jgi:hypothetical protein
VILRVALQVDERGMRILGLSRGLESVQELVVVKVLIHMEMHITESIDKAIHRFKEGSYWNVFSRHFCFLCFQREGFFQIEDVFKEKKKCFKER